MYFFSSLLICHNCFAAFQLKEPRQHGVGGGLLPSARDVSNKVHRAPGGEIPEFGITLFLMQWGQFTDHDITLTPIPTGTFFL